VENTAEDQIAEMGWKFFFLFLILIQLENTAAADSENEPSLAERTTVPKNTSVARDQFGSLSLGHLVTSNNNVLKAGQVSAGSLFAGIGVTDGLMVGMSPFVAATYGMNNFIGRFATNVTSRERIGFDFQYFKTYAQDPTEHGNPALCKTKPCQIRDEYPNGFDSFKMEAWDAKFTYSLLVEKYYRFSMTGSFYYYIDDERPFSLRMDPENLDPYALTITTLHEIRLSKGVFINLEGGMWGINYQYPYIHSGCSLDLQYEHFLLGMGASSTYSPSFPEDKAKMFKGYDSRLAVHPEVQIQLVF
jgi:hypothetical protein